MQPIGCINHRMPDLFQALADPTRRTLLDRLHTKGGLTLGELAEGASISRQGIAKHLGVLEGVDLVTVRWDGRCKRHFLNPVPLSEIVQRWVGKFEEARLDALADFKARCEAETRASDDRAPEDRAPDERNKDIRTLDHRGKDARRHG